MLSKGTWKGQYKYDSKAVQQTKGVEATNFVIDITDIHKENFTGTVEDDLATGGTEGIGKITGRAVGTYVEFIKQMPIMTTINPKTGVTKTYNKKHMPIKYTGTLSADGKTITGVWKFKVGFILMGIIRIMGVSITGTWTMTVKE
jgi:hypothetical protein